MLLLGGGLLLLLLLLRLLLGRVKTGRYKIETRPIKAGIVAEQLQIGENVADAVVRIGRSGLTAVVVGTAAIATAGGVRVPEILSGKCKENRLMRCMKPGSPGIRHASKFALHT